MRFSIRSLAALTTLTGILLGAYIALGPSMIELVPPTCIVLGLLFAGVRAHQNHHAVPFWKCVAAYTLISVWGFNHHPYPPSDQETIVAILVCAASIVLAGSSILKGHWATKIMGLTVFVPTTFVVLAAIHQASKYEFSIGDYWLGA